MKKSCRFICILVVLLASLVGFVSININQTQVNASDFTINDNTKKEYGFDDTLFSVVQKMYAQLYGVNVPGFNAYIFYSEYANFQVEEGSDAQKIQQDLSNGILNLTTGKNAAYKCLEKRSPIKDITGLNYLKLDNITTLILDDNAINSIDSTDLDSLKNLKVLSVKNNNLISFNINPDIKTINNLNLSNNNLSSIDISNLSINGGDNPSCNLSFNNFKSINDIIFSSSKLAQLNLSFNSLATLTDQEWTTLNSKMIAGAVADIIVQGTSNFSNLLAGDTITVYQNSFFENFQVVISYNDDSLFYLSQEDNVICYNEATSDIETVVVPAGKIVIEFYSNGNLISKTNNPGVDEVLIDSLSSKECFAKIKSPKVLGYSEGKEIKDFSQDGDIKIVLNLPDINHLPNKEDVLSSTNGATFYYYLTGKDEINSSEFSITKNGTYNYNAYVYFDEIKGEITNFSVARRDMSGIVLGIVIIIIIFVVCSAIYFLSKWIRDGAVVAPLSEKELFKVKRKRSYLSDLDASNKKDDLLSVGTNKEVGSYYNENQRDDDNSSYNFDHIRYDKYSEDEFSLDDENSNLDNRDFNTEEDLKLEDDFDEERDD